MTGTSIAKAFGFPRPSSRVRCNVYQHFHIPQAKLCVITCLHWVPIGVVCCDDVFAMCSLLTLSGFSGILTGVVHDDTFSVPGVLFVKMFGPQVQVVYCHNVLHSSKGVIFHPSTFKVWCMR